MCVDLASESIVLSPPIMTLQDVALSGRDGPLVEPLSLSLAAGRVLTIVGPNGVGKSTLLRVMAGEQQPWQGQVALQGKALTDWPLEQRALQVAVLPQAHGLSFPFRVHEVVAMGRAPHAISERENARIVDEVLSWLSLTSLRERRYPELSGGEKQRVQIARVIAQLWRRDKSYYQEIPRLLLLDEPTTALDLAHQQQLLSVIRQMAQWGVAVVVTTHDINVAAQLADQVIAMSANRCLALGPPDRVLTSATLKQLYGVDVALVPHPKTGKTVYVI